MIELLVSDKTFLDVHWSVCAKAHYSTNQDVTKMSPNQDVCEGVGEIYPVCARWQQQGDGQRTSRTVTHCPASQYPDDVTVYSLDLASSGSHLQPGIQQSPHP